MLENWTKLSTILDEVEYKLHEVENIPLEWLVVLGIGGS